MKMLLTRAVLFFMLTHAVGAKYVDKNAILRDIKSVFEDDSPKIAELLKRLVAAKFEDDSCKNTENTDCEGLAKAGACTSHIDSMKMFCKKTCDLCGAPAPPAPPIPKCASSKYGCCWDNETVAESSHTEDPVSSQCPVCRNKYSDTFCTRWSSDCTSTIIGQGDVMKKNCPETCGVPCGYNLAVHHCKDQSEHCSTWFKEGKCQTEIENMAVFCRDTCDLCNYQVPRSQ